MDKRLFTLSSIDPRSFVVAPQPYLNKIKKEKKRKLNQIKSKIKANEYVK